MDYKSRRDKKFKTLKGRNLSANSNDDVEVVQKKVKPSKWDDGKVPILEESIERMKSVIKSLKLPDFEPFLNDQGRHECPVCNRNRKFYCHDCLVATSLAEQTPKVDLPISLSIIHHESEKRAKSSALPLKVLSPEQIEVIDSAKIQGDDFDPETTLILFPNDKSIEVKDLSEDVLRTTKRVVAVDCTWFQTAGILNRLKQKEYKYVKIADYDTTFWRHQSQSSKHLATCEAIYYFYKEYKETFEKVVNKNENYSYGGEYDGLLFYYIIQYLQIQRGYLKAQTKGKNQQEDKEEERDDN